MSKTNLPDKNVIFLVTVAALGYFVDIYDLVLFSIVRIESFREIGIAENDMRVMGEYVINMQMGGLLLGGILWGIIGDKVGRIKVLFGSIIMYSAANIANGMVTDIDAYAFVRFIAGIGLAGELGAGITLVSETMSKENRGYGTMIVAAVGLLERSSRISSMNYLPGKPPILLEGDSAFYFYFFELEPSSQGCLRTLLAKIFQKEM